MLDAMTTSDMTRTRPRSLGLTRNDILVGFALILIMLVGGYFRFVGQNWDDFVRFHPDERFLSTVVSQMGGPLSFTDADVEGQYARCLERYPDTGGRGGFFDAQCSPLNPHNTGSGLYVYGTLPSFIVRAASDLAAQVTGDTSWGGYNGVHLVGRALSALAETGIILVVFFIGVHLHDKWVGLLAAALYAATVFSIQQAHFWTADAMTNLFAALTVWAAIRVQTSGRLGAYVEFGLYFGATLASRINVAPLLLLLFIAAGLRLLPLLDGRVTWGERRRIFAATLTGLVIAGFLTFFTFRIFNPYAFVGPGFFGIINTEALNNPNRASLAEIIFNPRWLKDIGQAQYLVSGSAESPPNWQWTGRTPYLFPLSNMSLWGMGILLALAGWGAWLWSGFRLVRGNAGALRNVLPFVWILVYFGWVGNLWVMSMRYYLPLYPMFALLAAWGLIELVRRANRSGAAWRKILAWGWLAGVLGFTILWALMFTNIYRHLFTPAEAGHWIWENIPGDFAMQVEGADTPLINIAVVNGFGGGDDTPLDFQASRYEDGQVFTTLFTAPADGTISRVYSPHLGDPLDDEGAESLRIKISAPDSSIVLAEGTLTTDLTREDHILGGSYDIAFSPAVEVKQGQTYAFTVEVVSGGPFISAGEVFAWEGDWDEPVPPKVCALPDGITLADDPPPGLVGARDCNGRDLWGGLINGYKLQVYYEEEPFKRDHFQTVLDNTDYLIIGTNRRYDSQSRIPFRWPMTMRYYDALFSGQLGFELVETFQRTFEFGPFRVSDQYLPTYDAPKWLNEFEAEEAFHVYDHPAVMIFRKTDAYTSENTREILNSVSLNRVDAAVLRNNCSSIPPWPESNVNYMCDPTLVNVVPLYSLPADPIPTLLRFPPEVAQIQYENGTWSNRFDSASAINTQPIVTILGWWVAIMAFGWVVWPLLFVVFPSLADRGYGVAKIAGLLLVGWLAWVVSSARVPMWSQGGVLTALLVALLVSLLMVWRVRGQMLAYLRSNLGTLLWIEAITLALFAAFLFIRLTNPDLWHPSFGGEKPMDFAYFNGVLRSTVFPPIDPWQSGGYINYYYYGYVTVGAPVLLLGIVPSIAYNLIIPTLFALTGISAFSVAFNVVSVFQAKSAPASRDPLLVPGADEEIAPDHPLWSADEGQQRRRAGNPWIAGIAAMLLAVILGNLDTPRVFIGEALMKTGFYGDSFGAEQYLIGQYTEANNGVPPTGQDLMNIVSQAETESSSETMSALRGLRRMLDGDPLDIAPNRWYWAATRVIAEPSNNTDLAIAEFPFFTFIYGDLHAHMIAMPMLFLVMAFVLNELLTAGKGERTALAAFAAIFVGALTVGMLRGTNTWDWPTFMLLSVLGLGFAWWVGTARINRRSLVNLGVRVGGFIALSFLVALPYTTWYAATYNSAKAWEGPRTHIWQYLTIHGAFLFLVTSLLAWETARWLRSVYVRSLRGMGLLLLALLVMVGAVLAGAVVLAASGYPVTVLAAPLLLWVAVLFLRAGQSREMHYVLALSGLALALTLGVEYIVLDGDVGRQNTVFKFYIQAWLLFSAVGGAAVAWLIQSSGRWPAWLRAPWYALFGLLFLVMAWYPAMAARGRALDRMGTGTPFTLDGMTFMQYSMLFEGDPSVMQSNPELGYFSLKDDYDMIRWLQENIEGSPTIIEGMGDREYRWQSRVAIYTGLPSVAGWRFHQTQQRTFEPLPALVNQRVANVNAFYALPDINIAWGILQHYDVGYIVVSNYEKAYYPETGLAKFAEMVNQGLLEEVYQQGAATVYQVNQDAAFDLVKDVPGGI